MPNTTTLAQLRDMTSDANGIGIVGDSGEEYRNRWNQPSTVRVTDAEGDSADTPVFYTSKQLHYPWIRGDSQHSANHSHQDPDYITPMEITP